MIKDANHTYAYDAENRLISVDGGSTAKYGYDALGMRVERTVGSSAITQYVHDLGGQVILETDGNGNGSPTADYIYIGGNLVAEYKNGTTYFTHQDHLGSSRLLTGMGQSQLQNGGFEQGSQGWNLCSGIPQVITDATRAHSGSNFLWASTSGYACAISNQFVSVSPGDQLMFGGWTYLESGSSYLRWVLVGYDVNHNQVGGAVASPDTANPQIWTQGGGHVHDPFWCGLCTSYTATFTSLPEPRQLASTTAS